MKKTLITFSIVTSLSLFGCSDNNSAQPSNSDNGYFPLTNGSNWVYDYTNKYDTGNPNTQISISINGDTTLNNRIYTIQLTSPNQNRKLYRRNSDTIFSYGSPIFENIELIERKGSTWTIVNEGGEFTCNVKEVGISHSVNGKQYNDVLHEMMTSPQGDTMNLYYAKNVGLIETITEGSTRKLKTYSIK